MECEECWCTGANCELVSGVNVTESYESINSTIVSSPMSESIHSSSAAATKDGGKYCLKA